MIKIKTDVTRENGEIELTTWEVDTDKDFHLFGIEIGEKINISKKLLVNISLPEKYLGRVINELEDVENKIEEEENEGEYDGSLQQAHDDHERTEVAALKRDGY